MNLAVPQEWRLPVFAAATLGMVLFTSLIIGRVNEARHLAGLDLSTPQDVAVRLGFEPERFHIEAFQDVGRYQGWSDERALIMSAEPQALRRIARNYWIGSIEPLEVQE